MILHLYLDQFNNRYVKLSSVAKIVNKFYGSPYMNLYVLIKTKYCIVLYCREEGID